MYLESIRTFWLLKGGAFGGAVGGNAALQMRNPANLSCQNESHIQMEKKI